MGREHLYRPHAIERYGISEATADRIVALGDRVGMEIYAEPGADGGLGLTDWHSIFIVQPAPGGRWRLTRPYRSELTYRTPTGAIRAALRAERRLRRHSSPSETVTLREEMRRRYRTMPPQALADLDEALARRFKPGTTAHPCGDVVHRIEAPSGDPYDAIETICGLRERRFAVRFLRLHPASETMAPSRPDEWSDFFGRS